MRTEYHVRELASMSEDEIWAMGDDPSEMIDIAFDDGYVAKGIRMPFTIFSWYSWQLFDGYPDAPITKKNHMLATRLTKKTSVDLFEKAQLSIVESYGKDIDRDRLGLNIMRAHNAQYNAIVRRLGRYVTSIDILDFIEIQEHPKIKEIRSNVKSNHRSITLAYERALAVLLDPDELRGNAIAEAVKSGLVRQNQVMQCVILRGLMSEIDQTVFPVAIMDSYTSGITKIHDVMVESRSATRSQINTTGPVRDAEYLNRVEQLATSMFVGVETELGEEIVDCGNRRRRERTIQASDFNSWLGKHFFDTRTNDWSVITQADREWIVSQPTVGIRSILDCKVPGRQHCCRSCYGDLYYNIPENTNYGWFAAVTTCKDVSQIIISTKHYDQSAVVEEIRYTDYELAYVRLGSDPHNILLNTRLDNYANLRVVIPEKQASRFGEIMEADLDGIAPSRISQLSTINILYEDPNLGGDDAVSIPVSIGSQASSMSREMLKYIRDNEWYTDEQGDYVINLENWDYNQPMFVLPMKQLSMMDFFNTVERMLRSGDSKSDSSKKFKSLQIQTLNKYTNPWDGVMALHELIRKKFDINIVHLEVMVQALRVVSLKPMELDGSGGRDWRMPVGGEIGSIAKLDEVISNRSLGAKFAHEDNKKILDEPYADLITNRHASPMDALLMGSRTHTDSGVF